MKNNCSTEAEWDRTQLSNTVLMCLDDGLDQAGKNWESLH